MTRNKESRLCLLLLLLLTALTTTPAQAKDYVPQIIAGVVKADSWTMGNNKEGIYLLEAKKDGQLTQIKDERDVYLAPLGGAVYQDGTMYGIHFKQDWDPYDQAYTYTIYSLAYDMKDWSRTKGLALNSLYGNLISSCGMTHDPVTGLNYGIFYNFNMSYQVINRKLATIDFINTEASGAPRKEVIGIVETPFAAIAASENGFLYGVGQDGFLYIIEKTCEDGSHVTVIPIGDLGITDISTNPSSMTFDPRTKKLYWSYVSTSQKSFLYEIDYNLGQVKATQIMQVPDNAYLVNMYIAPMQAADDAPAAIEDLKVQFEGEQTTGSISFTMPSLTYAGDALNGELGYTIYADDDVLATGMAKAGSEVVQQVSIDSEGREIELRVVATNDNGEGAPAKTTQYIGRDTPLTVANLRLSYSPETEYMRLTWDAPTQGTHGLMLTQANLSYNVVRQPDSVVVAEGLKLPAFNEKIEKSSELKSYYYDVVAVNGTHVGDTASSNKAVVGQALVPPFDENFKTQQGFDRFTVVDANNDGKTWNRFHKVYTYSGTTVDYAQMTAHSTNADDDYLLTPPLQMEKGGRYALSFTACKGYATKRYDQKLRILVGMAGDDLADYEVVMDTTDVDDVNLQTYATEVSIHDDGIYQIAFHAISNAGSDVLNIDEIHLAASLLSSAPDSVQHIVATADPNGYLKATVTFTAPAVTLHGSALAAISHIDITDIDCLVLGTLSQPTPGETCTMQANNLKNGINTYYIICYDADGNPGAKASFTIFAGQDYPLQPTNAVLADNGTEAVLTWDAPTTGLNGLPLNPELTTYNLYTISADGYPTLLKAGITSPYKTGIKTATGQQQLLYYAIDAQNSAGLSELVATNGLVAGKPYTLPYVDVFDKTNDKFVWLEGDYADWNIGLAKISSDGDEDGYAMAFQPNRADFGFYNLGKLTLQGAEKPTLSFDYYALPSTEPASLTVLADTKQDGSADVLTTIDYQKEKTVEWKHVDIDLTPYKDEAYIILKFSMASLQAASEQTVIVFDDLRVYNDEIGLGIAATRGSESLFARQGIYRLDGTRVNPSSGLRKGIYIVGGRKTVIK